MGLATRVGGTGDSEYWSLLKPGHAGHRANPAPDRTGTATGSDAYLLGARQDILLLGARQLRLFRKDPEASFVSLILGTRKPLGHH